MVQKYTKLWEMSNKNLKKAKKLIKMRIILSFLAKNLEIKILFSIFAQNLKIRKCVRYTSS